MTTRRHQQAQDPPGKRRRKDQEIQLPCVETAAIPWWENISRKVNSQNESNTDPLNGDAASWWSRTHAKVFGNANGGSDISQAPPSATLPPHPKELAPLLQFFTYQIQNSRNETRRDLQSLKDEMSQIIGSKSTAALNPSDPSDNTSGWKRKRKRPNYTGKHPHVSLVKRGVRRHLRLLLKLPGDGGDNFEACISEITPLSNLEHGQYLRGEFSMTAENFRIDLKPRGRVQKKFNLTAAFVFAKDFTDRINQDAWYMDMARVPNESRTPAIIQDHFLVLVAYLKRLYKSRISHPVSVEDNRKRLKECALHSRQRKTLIDRRYIVRTEPKYAQFRQAFELLDSGDMSGDETDTETPGPTKSFVRAAPWWRSEKLKALCWDIDETDEQRKRSSVVDRHRYNVGPRPLQRRHLMDVYAFTKAPEGLPFDWYRVSWYDALSDEEKYRLCPVAPIMG